MECRRAILNIESTGDGDLMIYNLLFRIACFYIANLLIAASLLLLTRGLLLLLLQLHGVITRTTVVFCS